MALRDLRLKCLKSSYLNNRINELARLEFYFIHLRLRAIKIFVILVKG